MGKELSQLVPAPPYLSTSLVLLLLFFSYPYSYQLLNSTSYLPHNFSSYLPHPPERLIGFLVVWLIGIVVVLARLIEVAYSPAPEGHSR